MKKLLVFLIIGAMVLFGCTAKSGAPASVTSAGETEGTVEESIIDDKAVQSENVHGAGHANPGGVAAAADSQTHVFSNHTNEMELMQLDLKSGVAARISDERVYWICADSDWVYFSAMDEDVAKLFRIKADGQQEEMLAEVDAWFPMLYNGWIYYQDGGSDYALARIDVKSKEVQKLSEKGSDLFCIWQDQLVYSEYGGGGLYQMNLDGSEVQLLMDVHVRGLASGAASLWYMTGKGDVYEYLAADQESVRRFSSEASFLLTGGADNATGYVIDKSGHLYQIRDGEETLISPESAEVADACAFEHWIYYRDMNDSGNLVQLDVDTLNTKVVGF